MFIINSSCVIGSESSTRFCVSCCVWYSCLHCHISHQCPKNLCSDHQLFHERITDQSCTRPAVPCTHRYTAVQTTCHNYWPFICCCMSRCHEFYQTSSLKFFLCVCVFCSTSVCTQPRRCAYVYLQ